MSRTPLVLGVDGGGTKSLGLIADQDGHVLAQREVGPSNPNVVGFEEASETLSTLVRQCCDDVRCLPAELSAIVFGLAGAGKDESRRRIAEHVNTLLVRKGDKALPVTIDTDARIALEGAFDGKAGVVVIAGTGSVVIGKSERGEILKVGGWGRILGDEGSGYYIGRKAVMAVTVDMDGRGSSGILRNIFAERLQWHTRDDIVEAVYQSKVDLSSVAPLVLDAAASNDIVAQKILEKAAIHLVEQISALVVRLGIHRKVGLVMYGGLIERETVYANLLHIKIMKVLPQVDIRPPMNSPAQGAVLMALGQLRRR